jgi:hypothetical protein
MKGFLMRNENHIWREKKNLQNSILSKLMTQIQLNANLKNHFLQKSLPPLLSPPPPFSKGQKETLILGFRS